MLEGGAPLLDNKPQVKRKAADIISDSTKGQRPDRAKARESRSVRFQQILANGTYGISHVSRSGLYQAITRSTTTKLWPSTSPRNILENQGMM